MKQMLHIFAKDSRQFWPEILSAWPWWRLSSGYIPQLAIGKHTFCRCWRRLVGFCSSNISAEF